MPSSTNSVRYDPASRTVHSAIFNRHSHGTMAGPTSVRHVRGRRAGTIVGGSSSVRSPAARVITGVGSAASRVTQASGCLAQQPLATVHVAVLTLAAGLLGTRGPCLSSGGIQTPEIRNRWNKKRVYFATPVGVTDRCKTRRCTAIDSSALRRRFTWSTLTMNDPR